MKLTPTWRNRLRNLTTIFLVLTVVAIIYTLIQWILSEPGSFEPLNVLFFAVFSVASAISAWLSRPDNVQPPASSEIAVQETLPLGPLRQKITDQFSLDELRVLCLDLGIRYDNLAGDTISTKSASLLAYADRRGQLDQLIVSLKRERPSETWPLPNNLEQQFALRRNVRATWIDGVLKQSVTEEIALELNLTIQPHALTRKVIYVPGQEEIPIKKDLLTLFDEYGSLLILGEPGGGKTMTLLQLAEKLLERAARDSSLSTPVILNLASWASEQKPLKEWLIDELWQQYQLPRKIGDSLIQENRLIYLLDGLDEVAEESRVLCVSAINDFKAEKNVALIVCCRVWDYNALLSKLNLGVGIRIQLLTDAQVEQYLNRQELKLQTVYELWKTDENLRELTRTPLVLSILTLAYRDIGQNEIEQQASPQAQWGSLYDHYVREMFNRRPILEKEIYSEVEVKNWLINLAYGMLHNNQTVFYLEKLQSSWLPNEDHKKFYARYFGFLFGNIFAVAIVLLAFVLSIVFSNFLAERFVLFYEGASVSIGYMSNRVFMYNDSSLAIQINVAILALILGFGVWVLFNWSGKKQALRQSIQFYEQIYLQLPQIAEIPHRLKNRFSIKNLEKGERSLIGLMFLMVPIILLLTGRYYALNYGWILSTLFILLFLFLIIIVLTLDLSVRGQNNPNPLYPNQGIRVSLIHSARMFLLNGFIVSGLFMTVFGLILPNIFADISPEVINFAMVVSLCLGIFGGTIISINYARAIIMHYTLRYTLAKHQILPFPLSDQKFTKYLDAMVDRILLRRVGGGWVFIHRTLLEYFASLHPNAQVEVKNE